jgi:FAD/FMN-containing dehydrogenase
MTTFTGKFFTPSDAGFDEAAVGRVFNARRPSRRPEAVLLAETLDDIIGGVKYAKEHNLGVAIRSGGHSWAAWSVREETLLIDLGLYQEMDYDPATGIASATPATKGGEVLDPYLASVGRFFNGGHCPTVGIGGFLLQGGQGLVARGWGWAAESVVAVDSRRRNPKPRPVLGGPRCWPVVPRCGHALLPKDPPALQASR